MFHVHEFKGIAVLTVLLAGLGLTAESRASGSTTTCQRDDYTIELGEPIVDQWIGFERWSVVGVQFVAPAGMEVVAIDYEPSSATASQPIIGEDYVVFSSPPAGEEGDFTVYVSYWDVDDPDPPAALPTVPVVFKPRRDCPS